MKAIITGLPELADANQVLLGQCILLTMQANGFHISSNMAIEFQPDDGKRIDAPEAFKPKGVG